MRATYHSANCSKPDNHPELCDEPVPAKVDMVNQPPHYTQGGIECIDAIKAALGPGFNDFLRGQVIKYVWRGPHKGSPSEDYKKAQWYLNRLLKELEEGQNGPP